MADFERNPDLKYPKRLIKATFLGIPLMCFAVLIVEAAERYGFYGGVAVNSLYMRTMYNYNASQVTLQSNLLTFWSYGTTVFCGWMADAYFGKIKTIGFFGLFYVVGVVLQAMASMSFSWEDFPYHTGDGPSQYFYWCSIFFIGLGTGAIKSNVGPLLSEQITRPSDALTEKVFRYFYWAINFGAVFAFVASPILHTKDTYNDEFVHGTSYYLSYWLAAAVLFLGVVVFFCFSPLFIVRKRQQSPVLKFFKAIISGIKNRKNPSKVEGETNFIFKAEGITEQEMIDYKRVFGICGLLIHYPTFWFLYNEVSSYVTVQGSYMEGPSWLTPDLLQIVDPLTIIIFVPFCDAILFPMLRSRGFELKIINRIAIGYILMALAGACMIVFQVLLQHNGYWIDDGSYKVDKGKSKMPVWYTVIPFALCGFGEIFASVTLNEFTYSQAPTSMKSVMFALGAFTNCGSSILGLIISPSITNENLHWILLAFGIICVIQAFILPWQFRNYNYRSVVEDNMNTYSDRRPTNASEAMGVIHSLNMSKEQKAEA